MRNQSSTSSDRPAGAGPAAKFTLEQVPSGRVTVKVVGVGGCGGNIVDHMIKTGVEGVDFCAVNTDEQALDNCLAPTKVLIGRRVTQGYGTGSNPDVGREAALEDTEDLTEMLGDVDMVFLVIGLGGGTGTGAGPSVAALAKQAGALTVAAAVKPFEFEGPRRANVGNEGLDNLVAQVDTAVVVENQRSLDHIDAGSGFFENFKMADQCVLETLKGITDIIMKPGIMNSDFADVRAVLGEAGLAVVGSSMRSGRDAAVHAARDALASSSFEQGGLSKANKVLISVTGSDQLATHDATQALGLVQRELAPDVNMIIGIVQDDSLAESVRVLVIASGLYHEGFKLDPTDDAPEAFPQAEPFPPAVPSAGTWHSETPVEVLDTEPDEPVEAVAPAAEEQQFGELAYEEAEDRAAVNGGPIEFMPPPKIREEDFEQDESGVRRPGFFSRSIFR